MKNEYKLLIAKLCIDISAGVYFAMRLIALGDNGLTINNAIKIASLTMLISIITNLPTGIFADKFGPKISSLLGFSLKALGMLLLVTTTGYTFAFISFALYVVGWSFEDGAFRTWIIRLVDDTSESIKKLNINLRYINSFGLIIGAIIGSTLFDYKAIYPWQFSLLLCVIATIATLFVPDVKHDEVNPDDIKRISSLPKAFIEVIKDKVMLNFAILEVFLYSSLGFFSAASYPYINEVLPANIFARVGIFQLCVSIGSISGNFLLQKLKGKPKVSMAIFYLFPVVFLINVLIPVLGFNPIIFLAVTFIRGICSSFFMNLFFTAQDIAIKKHEKVRASVYSAFEIIRDGFSAIAMFIAAKLGGFPYTNIWIATSIVLAVFIVLTLLSNNVKTIVKEVNHA